MTLVRTRTCTMTTINSSRDVRKDDKIIAIMGPTGSGKSNFIDKLTGKKWSGDALRSVTQNVRAIRIKVAIPGSNEEIVLVDTPGFDDTHRSDLEILEMIADWLKDTYGRGVRLAGILYLHRISDRRITGTVNRNLRMLGKLSGVDPAKKLIFVTTMWDDKKVADRADANERELRNDFFKPMLDLGADMDRFKNTTNSAWKIVCQLLLKHEDHTVTLIQEEMGNFGKELPETKAAQEVMSELQKLLAVHKKTIQELKRAAEKADNQQMIASLNKQLAENQKQMDKTYKEAAKLKISFFKKLGRFFGAKLKKEVELGH